MMQVKISSNLFSGVPFPLVLGDRFFHMYTNEAGSLKLDVIRWDVDRQEPVYDVMQSAPLVENIENNPTGIVTFASNSGGFLFKFRPKPGVSQIFGVVPVDSVFEAHCSDRQVRVLRDGHPFVTLRAGQVSGCPIGLKVGADGSISLASNDLPPGMNCVIRTAQ
jgi:hypothetical protein